MNIDQSNLANLTGLWKKYGAQQTLNQSPSILLNNIDWPHRCWLDWDILSSEQMDDRLEQIFHDTGWIEQIPDHALFSLLPIAGNKDLEYRTQLEQLLSDQKWQCRFEQTAMYLPLEDSVDKVPLDKAELQIHSIESIQDISKWINICSEAFAYEITPAVIEQLASDNDIQILLGMRNGHAIASALLYKTGSIIGLHQMGVKQAFQGQGVARKMMHNIITVCRQWDGEFLTLQASQVGRPLYESFGFKTQFQIKNFQKKPV